MYVKIVCKGTSVSGWVGPSTIEHMQVYHALPPNTASFSNNCVEWCVLFRQKLRFSDKEGWTLTNSAGALVLLV